MALTQQQLDEQNRLLGRTQFNTGTAKIGTSISSENITPQEPIKIPPQPTTDYSSTLANTNAVLGANTSTITPATTETQPTGIEGLLKDYINQPAPTSAADTYTSLFGTSGIDTKQQDFAAKQQTLNAAQAKLGAINARLAGISAEAQAAPIQLQQQVEGRGVTAGGLAPIQAGKLREIALRALPVQAEALGAQAEVAAAQGNAALSQSILNQAQDHLDRVFQITMTDAQNQYNYKKDIRDKVYQYATAAEKTKLDALQREDDKKLKLYLSSKDTQKSIADSAMSNRDVATASKITALNPDSPTFQADLARLQGQIKPKASDVTTGAPTSYKEWELAGKPGTYEQWLKESNIKAPTVAQQTVAEYAARIEQAIPTLENLTPKITGMNFLNFKAQLALPSALQSTEMQQYMQAASNFINAKLRRESGAVISPSEFTEARSQYLPQPGDKEEVLKQKKANRDLVYASLRKAAGNAYESVNDLIAKEEMMAVGTAQPKTIEYPIGSGKRYSVDAQGNMTPL